MSFEIRILPQAEKEIRKLPNNIADDILLAIENLSQNPKPVGCIQMNDYSTKRIKVRIFHRIKVKRVYRIIYHINNNILTVSVVKVGHRNKVYK
jgi:mRNA interferase RelE/StbE